MKKNIYLVFFILALFSSALKAQVNRSNYALLWEISGNGLLKKSYLFGSMHLNDKRVFEFSDSLLPAMESCEAFAAEVDLDAFIQKFVDDFDHVFKHKSTNSTNDDRGWVSPFGLKEGDKATFLDAYLFNLAKKSGKQVYGLEDIDQHLELIDELFDDKEEDFNREHELYDDYVDMYCGGNLADFQDFYDEMDSVHIARNYIQLESMESIMQKQSLFTVVGLLHLVGDQGLIQLLQNKGYTVRKVTATFTGIAQNYSFQNKPAPLDWYKTIDKTNGFSFETPQKPKLWGSPSDGFPVSLYFYPDIGEGIHYMIASAPLLVPLESVDDIYIKNVVDSLNKNFETRLISDEWIKNEPNQKVYYCSMVNENEPLEYMAVRFIFREGFFYFLMTMTIKDQIDHPDIQQYFNSFESFEPERISQVRKEYSNSKGAFSIEMYGEPAYQLKEITMEGYEEKQKLHLFISFNKDNKHTCVVRYNDYQTGLVVLDDSTVYKSFEKNLLGSVGDVPTERNKIAINGYEGRELICNLQELGTLKGQIFLRGSRVYILISQEAAGFEDSTYLSSFHFEPYEKLDLERISFDHMDASILFPTKYQQSEEVEGLTVAYEATEPSTGASFVFSSMDFSKYDFVENEDSLFEMMKETFTDEYFGAPVIFEKQIFENRPAGYFVFESENTNNKKVLKYVLNGHTVYALVAYIPHELLDNAQMESYLNSLEFEEKNIPEWSLFTNKLDVILEDLLSEDSLIQQKAYQAITNYEWEQNEIDKLYQALQSSYENHHYQEHLINRLLKGFELVQDSLTIPFLKEFYKQDATGLYYDEILHVLSKIQSEEAYKAFFEISSQIEDHKIHCRQIARNFSNSWSFFEPNLPRLLSLAGTKDDYSRIVVLLFTNLLKDSTFSIQDMHPYQTFLEEISLNQLDSIKHFIEQNEEPYVYSYDDPSPYHLVSEYLNLCEILNDQFSNVVFWKEIMNIVDFQWLRYRTLRHLLTQNISPEPDWIEPLMADSSYFITVLEMLQDNNFNHLIPKKYLNENRIAFMLMHNYLEDVGYYDFELNVLSTEKVKFLGKTRKVYVYKITFEFQEYDEEKEEYTDEVIREEYLGLAGPIAVSSKFINLSQEITNYSDDVIDFDQANIKEEIKKIVQNSESYYNKN